jgi:hypothetical protein
MLQPVAGRRALFETQTLDIEPPAVTEITGALLAAVVSAHDAERETRERHAQILEGHGEMPDLHSALDGDCVLDAETRRTDRAR